MAGGLQYKSGLKSGIDLFPKANPEYENELPKRPAQTGAFDV
jgi:hypothetical protein